MLLDKKNLKIFLPSGTGTTALYLQKFLPFEVLTCACVGDESYLKKQFEELEKDNFPIIVQKEKKYHFGKLYKEFYEIHNELLKQTDIEFDFLYDSLGWICFEKYVNSLNNNALIALNEADFPILLSPLITQKPLYLKVASAIDWKFLI